MDANNIARQLAASQQAQAHTQILQMQLTASIAGPLLARELDKAEAAQLENGDNQVQLNVGPALGLAKQAAIMILKGG